MNKNLAGGKKTRGRKRFFILLLVVIITSLWIVFTNIRVTTNTIKIKNDKIPASFIGYKIAVVADLHNKDWGDKLINPIKREQPDIIVIVGDLIDSSHTDLDVAIDFVKEAEAIAPIYYVSGNHEAWSGQYDSLKISLLRNGVTILDNDKNSITIGDDEILLVGLEDPDFLNRGAPAYEIVAKLQPKLEELIQDYKGYTVLLTHRPEHFELYVESGVDLAIAGHAHGGQIRIPFIGGLVAPNQGLLPKYTSGIYTKDKTSMIVSRGLGNSIIPVRINNTPELVIVELGN